MKQENENRRMKEENETENENRRMKRAWGTYQTHGERRESDGVWRWWRRRQAAVGHQERHRRWRWR
jgi:hypothetical protein